MGIKNMGVARAAGLIALVGLVTGLAACSDSQSSGGRPPAPSARPDLQGIWQVMNSAEWNLEPHEGRPGIPAGLGVVHEGTIPYQPWALEQRAQNFKNSETEDPVARCYMPGVPRATYLGLPFQILQGEDHVLMLYEYAHTRRMIPTDGTPFGPATIDFYMGEPRGRYEGDSLVIESRNFTEETWFDKAGNFHSDELTVVERFTKAGPDLIMYEARIEDPKVFTKPWTISMPLYRRKEKNIQILEYECYSFPGFEPPTGPPQSK